MKIKDIISNPLVRLIITTLVVMYFWADIRAAWQKKSPAWVTLHAGDGNWHKFIIGEGQVLELNFWTDDYAPEGTLESTYQQLRAKTKLKSGRWINEMSYVDLMELRLVPKGEVELYVKMLDGQNEKAWIRPKPNP